MSRGCCKGDNERTGQSSGNALVTDASSIVVVELEILEQVALRI